MKKILFVNPPQSYPLDLESEYQSYVPIGIACVAAAAQEVDGFQVKIFDYLDTEFKQYINDKVVFGKNDIEFINILNDYLPDIVAISNPFSMFLEDSNHIATIVKKFNSNILVFLGGISSTIKEIVHSLFKLQLYDVFIKGEGEITTKELLENFDKKSSSIKNLTNIKGIWYKRNNQYFECDNREYLIDLDKLPFPAFQLLNMESILNNKYYCRWRNDPLDKKSMPVFTSRGCPYNCIFCSVHSQVGFKHRVFSNEYVIKYINYCKDNFGVTHFHFEDDNLTLNYNKSKRLFEMLKPLNITWDTPNGVRADKLDENLIKLMIESGLSSLSVAAESGNQNVLNNIINKRLDLKSIINVSQICNKFNLPCIVFFVVGFPGETLSDISDTIEFAKKLSKKYGTINMMYVANPLPGTRLEKICKSKKYLNKKIDSFEYLKAIRINQSSLIKTSDFSKKDIFDLFFSLVNKEDYKIHGSSIPMFWYNNVNTMNRVKAVYPKLNYNKKNEWVWNG